MRYTEETLCSWTAPLSQTEEQRVENTVKMIRNAIKESDDLRDMDIDFFAQGSFANNTNVRVESDVDVCVMLKDVFYTEYPIGKNRDDYGFAASNLDFQYYRSLVKKALENKFGISSITDGNKSLKIRENTYHVQADVVPSFQLRNYRHNSSYDPNNYIEGVQLFARDRKAVSNYPKVHIKNGTSKNTKTNHRYKQLARIMKHIKNDMAKDSIVDKDKITSFLIECLVYNMPDNIFMECPTWSEMVKQFLLYLFHEMTENQHENWTEVSGMLYLFRGRKWTDADVKQWILNAWNYLGYQE